MLANIKDILYTYFFPFPTLEKLLSYFTNKWKWYLIFNSIANVIISPGGCASGCDGFSSDTNRHLPMHCPKFVVVVVFSLFHKYQRLLPVVNFMILYIVYTVTYIFLLNSFIFVSCFDIYVYFLFVCLISELNFP